MPNTQFSKNNALTSLRQRIGIFSVVLLTALFSVKGYADNQPDSASALYFAPLPMSNAKRSVAKSQALIQLLQTALNRPVIPKLYDDNKSILKAFQNGEIDFVEAGPLFYLELSKRAAWISPLVSVNQQLESGHHRCVLAAPVDGIKSISELAEMPNVKVALTDPLSTCGWLMTEHLLKQEGLKLSQMDYHFTGSHQRVALSLMRNEYQIGGLAKFIAERYSNFGLKILASSQPLPQFIIAGNPKTLSAQQLEQAKKAMLDYEPDVSWGLGSTGFSPVSMKLFEELKVIERNSHVDYESLGRSK